MQKNKLYLSILTKDNFLKNTIIANFSTKENVEFTKDIKPIDLVIFDNEGKKGLLNKIIQKNPDLIIINTSGQALTVDSLILKRPFKINQLLSLIQNYLEKSQDKNIIVLSDCIIDIQKKSINKKNEFLERLTEKEVAIIKYLFKNKRADKQTLLDKVWNYNYLSKTKVVESNIYKLRQKFKKHNLKNPILFKNGFYELNQ